MKTPCILICSLDDATGLCVGCGRSLQEIGGWSGYSDAMRESVMAELPERLRGLQRRSPTLVDAAPC